MVLDKDKMKAYNQEPEMCWECYNCVKICPTQAVDVRGYADFVPMGASVVPMRSTDNIMWTVKFRNGTVKRFKFPIRTTPEGKAEPAGGWANSPSLDGPVLFTEPESVGMSEVWTKK
jgi:adenylylsulfate reductase subunit B